MGSSEARVTLQSETPLWLQTKRGEGRHSFPDKGTPIWLGAILWNCAGTQQLGNKFQLSKEYWEEPNGVYYFA